MRKLFYILFVLIMFSACKTRYVHIPVESVKTEYKDRIKRDSVYLHDSIMVKTKGDTVWMEKYRYLYRDRIKKDSVFINDTIRVPYPVVETTTVNSLKNWQYILMACGVFFISVIIMKIKKL